MTTSYPLLLRLFDTVSSGGLSIADLERCLHLVESFVVRRSICGVPTNALNKLFLQWTRAYPASDHVGWLHESMSAGSFGRRFPNDAEFGEAFKNQPQYGRGATRFVLLQLENSFKHKEPVDLSQCTIEHIMPQTLSDEWLLDLGESASETHSRLLHTIGNLTLSAYNTELGNMSFVHKKNKLANTHIELNREVLDAAKWNSREISMRASALLERAKTLWIGPLAR